MVVEFDTWWNDSWEPDGNHIGINVNGDEVSVALFPFANPLNSGQQWYRWVDFVGASQLLEIRIWPLPVRPATPVLTYEIDLPGILGATDVFAGFTAGTGGARNHHDIQSWFFQAPR